MTDFEAAFKKLTIGVYVITVKSGEKANGMAAAWVSRVSHVPPLVMVSVGHTRYSHDLIREAGAFCVNVLAEGNDDYYSVFGMSSGRDRDKFEKIKYGEGKTGSPILEGTAGYLDCKVVSEHDAGDHTIFVGEVVEAKAYDKETFNLA